MKTVLVTGSNGFVGQHLVKELSGSGFKVIGVGGSHGTADNANDVSDYLELDLTAAKAAQTINFQGIDYVIHLAGLAAVGASFDQPLEYINTNIGIEVNLFEAALAQKAQPRFLIVSTGGLYDPKAPLPLTETASVVPSSPYAVSKIGQEQMARYYRTRDFESIIVRPFNHIGPGQNLGFIVPDLTKQVVAYEKGLVKEVLVGNLDAKRDYTDVRDIARAYRLLLDKGKPGETYNVCSGSALSGHEILASILKAAGVQPNIVEDPAKMRPSDTLEIYGSHQKLSADTGWQPEIALDATIADVVADWHRRV